jgi:hypothetical protein
MGWRADIYVPWEYPKQFLYDDSEIKRHPRIQTLNNISPKIASFVDCILYTLWLIFAASKYDYFIFYGKIRNPFYYYQGPAFSQMYKKRFILELSFLRSLKKVLVYIPSGCNDEYSQEQFRRFDDGKVCANCGVQKRCDDNFNVLNFEIVKRYFNVSISSAPGFFKSPNFPTLDLKYKVINFLHFDSKMKIPQRFHWKKTNAVRILHTASMTTRNDDGKNIKGSQYIYSAINQLKLDGYDIDFLHLQGVPSREIKFYQVQADLIIDQLIYGLWGSSGIEALALGKPLVCYLRPSWKKRFMQTFGYSKLPIIEATTDSIYSVLKNLLDNRESFDLIGIKSLDFAREHYSLRENTLGLLSALKKIKSEN